MNLPHRCGKSIHNTVDPVVNSVCVHPAMNVIALVLGFSTQRILEVPSMHTVLLVNNLQRRSQEGLQVRALFGSHAHFS